MSKIFIPKPVVYLFLLISMLGVFSNVDVSANEIAQKSVVSEQEDYREISEDDMETDISADTAQDEEPESCSSPIQHFIEWEFNTYAAPDFQAEVIARFPPQNILVYEWKEDGWALIYTYLGAYWAYLEGNKIYISRYIPIYDNKEDTNSIGNIGVQIVKIIEQEDNWVLIETWLGAKWIDLNSIRKSVLLDVPSYNQRDLGYITGCEIVSTAMMMNYTAQVSVCLTGYNENGLFYNDPWTGKKNTFITYDEFYIIWNKPIHDKIYGKSYPARKTLSYISLLNES